MGGRVRESNGKTKGCEGKQCKRRQANGSGRGRQRVARGAKREGKAKQ